MSTEPLLICVLYIYICILMIHHLVKTDLYTRNGLVKASLCSFGKGRTVSGSIKAGRPFISAHYPRPRWKCIARERQPDKRARSNRLRALQPMTLRWCASISIERFSREAASVFAVFRNDTRRSRFKTPTVFSKRWSLKNKISHETLQH